MDQPEHEEKPAAAPPLLLSAPTPRRRWRGAIVAMLALLALGALSWYLTHRPAEAPGGAFAVAAASGASGAQGGGPGGPGGRGGRTPPSTVGVATAARADLPVVLDALGTVQPMVTATVVVPPYVSAASVAVGSVVSTSVVADARAEMLPLLSLTHR